MTRTFIAQQAYQKSLIKQEGNLGFFHALGGSHRVSYFAAASCKIKKKANGKKNQQNYFCPNQPHVFLHRPLLSKSGLAGVSVDAVSQRSGVAKTTIYRHWPSRSALLLDACSHLSSRPQAPDTGSLKADLETLATYIAQRLRTANWATVLPSIIDAAERDPELAALQASLHGEMRTAFREIIERAQQKGELPRRVDPADVIASVLGPLFYRRWFSRESLDERFVKGVIKHAIGSA